MHPEGEYGVGHGFTVEKRESLLRYIGVHSNCSAKGDPGRELSPSVVNRFALIDAGLREAGYRGILYSPGDLRPDKRFVAGFELEDGKWIPVRAPIPAVNGNWTNRTRRLLDKGMGYQEFGSWAQENQIGVFVPHAFAELMGNKLETYKLVRGYHEDLHPLCEPYLQSKKQLEHFTETGTLSFIKPRTGSKGNRIVTVRRDESGLVATRYRKGKQRRMRGSLQEIIDFVAAANGPDRKCVIQHGVDTMRHGRSTFDVRVTMVHDGHSWHWLHEARISPPDSDISNVSQGGTIAVTEDLLYEVLGADRAQDMLRLLESESFGLAAYLERLHPGEIMELAFDFAIDREWNLRLLEVNTKPGMAGIGSEVTVFEKRPEQESMFERWVYPQADRLARFFLAKAAERER